MDGAHVASLEEMATTMSSAETAVYKGLQQCIETVMSEVASCPIASLLGCSFVECNQSSHL